MGSASASSPAVVGWSRRISRTVRRLSSASACNTASMALTYPYGYVSARLHSAPLKKRRVRDAGHDHQSAQMTMGPTRRRGAHLSASGSGGLGEPDAGARVAAIPEGVLREVLLVVVLGVVVGDVRGGADLGGDVTDALPMELVAVDLGQV